MLDELAATRDFRLAQDLLRAYHASRSGLITLGILRSERILQGDYAEWIVSHVLGLTLATSGVQKGFDATDSEGRTYQIKSRIVASAETRTSFDLSDAVTPFDFLVGVFFTTRLEVLAIVKLPYAAAIRLGRTTSTTHRVRWNRTSAADAEVEFLYRSNGATAESLVP